MHNSRGVLTRIDRLTGLPAAPDLRLHALHAGPELPLIVERRHHHMPPLPPLRVIAVMPDDEPLDAVVAGVNSRHNPNSKPGPSRIVIHEAGTRPGGHSRGQVAVGVGCR